MDKVKLNALVEVQRAIKKCDAELKALKTMKTTISGEVCEQFLQEGISNVKTEDGVTIHLHTMRYVNAKVDPERIQAWLDEHELSDFMPRKFNVRGFAAHVREAIEQTEEGEEPGLPADFQEYFEVGEEVSARVRGA